MKINVLGTEYAVKVIDPESDAKLNGDRDGYTDTSIKECVIDNMLEESPSNKANLHEYRKAVMMSGGDTKKKLSHILMIEEAHRLLKNVSEGGEGGNTRAKSVEFFCNLLAEIRTFGQGIIIADQIPTKIAPDTIKKYKFKNCS